MKFEDCKLNMPVYHVFAGECTIINLNNEERTVVVKTKVGDYNATPIYLTEIKENKMSMLTFDKNKKYVLDGCNTVYRFAGYMFEPVVPIGFANAQLDTNGNVKSFFDRKHLQSASFYFSNKVMQEVKTYKVAFKTNEADWCISEYEYGSVEEFFKNNTPSITTAYLLKENNE